MPTLGLDTILVLDLFIWMKLAVMGLRVILMTVGEQTMDTSDAIADHILRMPLCSVQYVWIFNRYINWHVYTVTFFQYVLITSLNVPMVELVTSSLYASLLNNVVMALLTVLEEKMNWITTVSVNLREQFV